MADGRPKYYILDDAGAPVPTDLLTWGRWMADHDTDRIVQQTEIEGRWSLSSIFLGLDHQHDPNRPPILWETMFFSEGGEADYQERHTTRQQALERHAAIAELIRKGQMA
jgi:hypothetical protein